MKIHFIIGGCWGSPAASGRGSDRVRIVLGYRCGYLGFRLVKG